MVEDDTVSDSNFINYLTNLTVDQQEPDSMIEYNIYADLQLAQMLPSVIESGS